MADGGGKSWLKYGCLGCLGVIGIIVLIVAVIGGLAFQRSKTIETQEQVLTRQLPGPVVAESPGISPEALAADMPGAMDAVGIPASGRVVLNLSGAGFFIKPAMPGEPMRVEGNFNHKRYELVENFSTAPDGSFIYEVSFQKTSGSSFIDAFAEIVSRSEREVHIYLPRDVPIGLEMNISQGGSQVELGGLWLTDADLDLSMGGVEVRFSEPLRAPMQSLAIDASMGGGAFVGIANASPHTLDVEFSMGGMQLDLDGEWKNDSQISIKTRMGGAQVELPGGVNIEGISSIRSREKKDGVPTLFFNISESNSEIEFDEN
jgi:hypothetical protein